VSTDAAAEAEEPSQPEEEEPRQSTVATEPASDPEPSAALPATTGTPTSTSDEAPVFGPWVEHRHRLDNVFQRFGGALLRSDVANVQAVLADARATDTRIFSS
jgi:hypothetical protein